MGLDAARNMNWFFIAVGNGGYCVIEDANDIQLDKLKADKLNDVMTCMQLKPLTQQLNRQLNIFIKTIPATKYLYKKI